MKDSKEFWKNNNLSIIKMKKMKLRATKLNINNIKKDICYNKFKIK